MRPSDISLMELRHLRYFVADGQITEVMCYVICVVCAPLCHFANYLA